jgi:hypothetical protein
LIQKESHYLEVCRYVVLNPVRAKAVKHPREWPWSSYRATGGVAPVPRCLTVDELLSYFGQKRGPAQEKYRQYVGEGVAGTTIWENLEAQSLLGLEGFADALRGHVTGKETVREIPKGQRLIGRASLKKLFDKVGISHQTSQSFRSIPAGYFARFRPPVSEHSGPPGWGLSR